VLSGKSLLQRELASWVVELVNASPAGLLDRLSDPLTSAEHDVLRLCADGRSHTQIGRALRIKPAAATAHVADILAKLRLLAADTPTEPGARSTLAAHSTFRGLI
jgi:DNA-binding NarL/FixJ family response regulator